MANRKAIVSAIIGNNYIEPWATKLLPTWLSYCDRNKIDLLVFLDPLDNSTRAKPRRLTWQKCLAIASPEAAAYDQIVWLDADIAINSAAAPNIFDQSPEDKIGAVGLQSLPHQSHLFTTAAQPSVERLHEAWASGGMRAAVEVAATRLVSRSQANPSSAAEGVRESYRALGFKFEVKDNFNSGVMTLSPKRHAALFKKVYDTYEELPGVRVTDNIPIPAEVYHNNLLHNLDSRFNLIFYVEMVHKYPYLIFVGKEYVENLFLASQCLFASSYFLHFAGTKTAGELFLPIAYDWIDLMKIGGIPFPGLFLDHNTLNSVQYTRSYCDQVSYLLSTPQRKQEFLSRTLVFRSSESRQTVTLQFDANSSYPGFYTREVDASSGLVFRWIDGRGGRISFEIERGGANFAKFRGACRFLGSSERMFNDVLQLLVHLNGYFPQLFSYEKCAPSASGFATVEFEGYAAISIITRLQSGVVDGRH